MPIALTETLTHLLWGKDYARTACLSIPWGFFCRTNEEIAFSYTFKPDTNETFLEVPVTLCLSGLRLC